MAVCYDRLWHILIDRHMSKELLSRELIVCMIRTDMLNVSAK